ncbi:hypothetical protein F8M41_017066 [Gigaspora margarita]|uniref:Uncharacterized protein n=1 Tax=Gigaspora margarita TaxID=4874 RepID=A0A8H4ANS1_GIGMA|nr:hypothetical protein F8M41_017066 [Gigaspora margarita]
MNTKNFHLLIGYGYNGNDGRGNIKYDRVVNIDVFAYETADNPRSLIQAWNLQRSWLPVIEHFEEMLAQYF